MIRRNRFLVLLCSLAALILASPFLGHPDIGARSGLSEVLMGLLFIAMVLAAAGAASRGRVSLITAWCMAVVADDVDTARNALRPIMTLAEPSMVEHLARGQAHPSLPRSPRRRRTTPSLRPGKPGSLANPVYRVTCNTSLSSCRRIHDPPPRRDRWTARW